MTKLSPIGFLLVLICSILALSNTFAGERFGLRGHVELGGTIDFTSTSFSQGSNSTGVFSIAPYAGYFPINGLEIGIRPLVTITSPSKGSSLTDLAIFVAPAWNFSSKRSTVTPFVEGLIGFSSSEADTSSNLTISKVVSVSGIAYGGRGGVKVQISDFGLLNFSLQYVSLDRTFNNVANRENRFSVGVGFTVYAY
jgi:hypothetical protein